MKKPFLDTLEGGDNEGKWLGYLSPEREAECRLASRACTLLDTSDHPMPVALVPSYDDNGLVRGVVLWCNRCGTIPFEHTEVLTREGRILVRFLTTEEGGRRTPPNPSDYRPTAYFDSKHHSCRIYDIFDESVLTLGHWTSAMIVMLGPDLPPEDFELYEGGRLVAEAKNLLTPPKVTC